MRWQLLYFFSMFIAACGAIVYHLSMKNVPATANVFFTLFVAYLAAACMSSVGIFLFEEGDKSFSSLSPACIGIAFGIVGIEVGFLLAYRSGWFIGNAALIANVLCTLILLPVGIWLYAEKLTFPKFIGAILCLIGLFLMNKRT